MGIGIEQYLLVGVATVLVLIGLWAIPLLQRLTHARQTLTYELSGPAQEEKYQELYGILKTHDLRVAQSSLSKERDGIKYIWRAYGKPDDHTSAMLALLAEEDVQEFRVIR